MMSTPDATSDIECAVDRIDRGLGQLLAGHRSPITTKAVRISIAREGEKLYQRHGRDGLVQAAMLIVVRNVDNTRYERSALLQDLWSSIE
jgi:hypothetical protein